MKRPFEVCSIIVRGKSEKENAKLKFQSLLIYLSFQPLAEVGWRGEQSNTIAINGIMFNKIVIAAHIIITVEPLIIESSSVILKLYLYNKTRKINT